MNLLRTIFLNNLPFKLFALVLAFLLWFQTSGQKEVQTSINIPIEFTNMPSDLEITNDYPRSVSVLITRQGSTRLEERNLSLVLDLRGAQPGIAVMPLTETNIRNLPSGVSNVDFEQSRLRLQLERTSRKLVSVAPVIVGEPAEGFQVGEINVYPGEALISGPQSKIAQIESAGTEPINIDGKSESFTQRVHLDLDDISIRIEETESVDVVVNIEELRDELTFRIPIRPSADEDRVALINYRTVAITVSIPSSHGETINQGLFRAYVSVPEDQPGGETVQIVPSVPIPEEYQGIVRVEEIDPETVRVTVRETGS